ncbi:hypothetical protein J1614_007507 [Plenodomus biglobosus]|nr:hypothetical protein J1614_007507 [Plenodomus biglobosus]
MDVSKVLRWNPFQKYASKSIVEEKNNTSTLQKDTKSKACDTTVERILSWPEEARPLKVRTWISYVYGFGDIILVLLPIYFIRKWKHNLPIYISNMT